MKNSYTTKIDIPSLLPVLASVIISQKVSFLQGNLLELPVVKLITTACATQATQAWTHATLQHTNSGKKIIKVASYARRLAWACCPPVRGDEFWRIAPIALVPLPDAAEVSCPLNASSRLHMACWEELAGSTGHPQMQTRSHWLSPLPRMRL